MPKLTIAYISDLQTNSTIGICPPVVNLDDGGTYHASRLQKQLWNDHLDFRDRAVSAKGNGELYTIYVGDIHDGDHHNTSQIITRNPATMQSIAADVIDPIARISDKMFLVRGTEAHVGKSASLEEDIAKDFDFQKNGNKRSWWQLFAEFRGYTYDIAHHTSMGSTPVGKGNAANKLAVETIFEYANRGRKPPNYVIRAHVHRHADSYENYITRAIILPCWQYRTAFVHRMGSMSLPSIGSVLCEIEDGKSPKWTALIYKPRTTEEVTWRE